MIKLGLLILSLQLSTAGFSQTTVDSIKQTVNNLFVAMNMSDSQGIYNAFADSAILQTIAVKQGKAEIRTDRVAAFAKSIGGLPKGAADERIIFKAIQTDGDLAVVWTPYQFYYNGKFSHCGVNSFQLVRLNGTWKIQYLIDTRRKTNCTAD